MLYNRATLFTNDILRDHNKVVHDLSLANNPYFFQAPVSSIVPLAGHFLAVNQFSNHSVDNINGYLTREILKSFWSITGPDGAHVYTPGHDQIPQNWYRRSSSNQYTLAAASTDLAIMANKYPDCVNIGGNTGTVNSFTGASTTSCQQFLLKYSPRRTHYLLPPCTPFNAQSTYTD
jgi:hypothetical protein